MQRNWLGSWIVLFAIAGAGCGGGDDPPPSTPTEDTAPGDTTTDTSIDTGADTATDTATDVVQDVPPDTGPVATLKRPSKSSTIAITTDEKLVVMSNPDDDSISIFRTADNVRSAKVKVGKEPWAVVIGPDNKTAYVANRADATVQKITGIDTPDPTPGTPVNVGSEPTGLALTPTGAKLVVAEWAEGRVSVIDTATMAVGKTAKVRNPRAVAITNNGDANDDDETVVVTEFYGVPVPGKEAKDDGRTGVVQLFSAKDLASTGKIDLAAMSAADVGFGVGASPNQLYNVAINKGKIYVPSVSASPQGPPRFDSNVAPVLFVADLATKAEVKGALGTTNLAKKVNEAIPTGPRQFLGEIVDVDFVDGTDFAYVLSRASDTIQRVVYEGTALSIGSTKNKQIDIIGDPPGTSPPVKGNCHTPSGIVTSKSNSKAYVNCWVSRRLGVVDLAEQVLQTTVVASDPPAAGAATEVQKGKRFFFTGRGRWAKEGWSSCGSCHPDGLSDNITWIFAAGPRQTTSMDGSFSHGKTGAGRQRVFNWTAIIDEMHDFEANTRGTSGGVGAITKPKATGGSCGGDLSGEEQVTLSAAPLGTPTATELAAGTGVCTPNEWKEINEYAKTIRPPRAVRFPEGDVAAGKTVFTNAGCAKCHGGNGWTISRRFWTPSTDANTKLSSTGPGFNQATVTWKAFISPLYTKPIGGQIQPQPAGIDGTAVIGPPQVPCVIRDVNTFGVSGDAAATDALELKPGTGGRAQGKGGYNVPSLYGLAVGAPYLHHGQAPTLEDLLKSSKFNVHTTAGNAVFAPTDTDIKNLVAFLLSIDAAADEIAVPSGFDDGCTPP